jgi:lysophospholipase L1-like esterase
VKLGPSIAAIAVFGAAVVGSVFATGAALWVSLGVAATTACLALRAPRLALGAGTTAFVLIAAELALFAVETIDTRPLPDVNPPSSSAIDPSDPLTIEIPSALRERTAILQGARVMPRSWQKQKLARTGFEKRPYRWHDVLHVFDDRKMRRTEPFPAKQPGRLRIVALGDSLTYGAGVPASWTWPSLLERWLSEDASVEVLNLGVSGDASEDVLALARELLPELDPDVLLYAVCLNDFLESRGAQPTHWQLPLPDDFVEFLPKRTRVGQKIEEGYAALLIRLGLRPDFYSEMAGSPDWPMLRARFARDVEALQALAEASGLPPVIALVLDQQPRLDGPGRRLAVAAEEALSAAGMQVIASEPYYRRFERTNLRVSPWEGHPNEQAMLAFASLFRSAVRDAGLLDEDVR